MRAILIFLTVFLLFVSTTVTTTTTSLTTSSLCPSQAFTLCILGADDGGSGAAWAAAALNISTVITSWDVRDIGGDLASGVRTDLFTSARNVGGLSLAYDRFARRASDASCGAGGTARIAPPGPSFSWLRGVIGDGANRSSLTFLSGWLPQPNGGRVGADGLINGLQLLDETGATCFLRCRYVIEGTSEGYALRAMNQSIRFGREGLRVGENCSDVSNCAESLSGRRVFGPCHPPREDCNSTPTVMGLAPRWANVSDVGEEEEDVSSAASAILTLKRYANASSTVPPDAPWLLQTPPIGFEMGSFTFITGGGFEGCLTREGDICRGEFEHAAGLPRWYEQPDSNGVPVHYLRLPGNPWPLKRAVDRKNFWYSTGALYYLQHYTNEGKIWGLDDGSYAESSACITTADFGASAFGGTAFEQLSCRLYRRVTARLASPRNAVGGEAMLPRPLFQPQSMRVSRTFWEPTALGVPLYPVDYRGVLLDTVPMPAWAGPEGLVSLVYGQLGGTDAHGIARRVLEPDPATGDPLVHNLLSPGAPRSTFQAQAALRIHATASNLGIGAVALVAAAELVGGGKVDSAPTALAQWIMARVGGALSLVDAGLAGTETYALGQLPSVFGVPPLNLMGYASSTWAPTLPRRANATLWFSMYACGLLEGVIPRWPPANASMLPPPPPLPKGVTLPWPSDDSAFLSRGDVAAWLEAIVPGSSSAVLTIPIVAPTLPCHLRDLRAVLTRHILWRAQVMDVAGFARYSFPTYALVDTYEYAGELHTVPDLPLNTLPCNTSAGLNIESGLLVCDEHNDAPLIRVCVAPALLPTTASSWWPAFVASADFALEQVPVPRGNSSIVNPGLYFLFYSLTVSDHGWFGILSDMEASGSNGSAGAGFDPSQSLTWGLRLPGGELIRADVPWQDGNSAVFSLRVVHDGMGYISASVNNVLILQGTAVPIHSSSADTPPAFGVRVGEGLGRTLWGGVVVEL